MNLPSGLIFFLDFKYGTNQPQFNAGDFVHGNTEVEGQPDGGLYGEGRYGYSINDQQVSSVSAEAVSGVSKARIRFDENLVSETEGENDTLRAVQVDLPAIADVEGHRAFTFEDPAIDEFYPRHTRYVQENGDGTQRFEFVVTPTTPADYGLGSGQTVPNATIEYHEQPVDFDRGDFEDRSPNPNVGGGPGNPDSYSSNYQVLDIPEIDFDLRQIPIVAKTRKLKAVWTPEFAQDLNAYHSIDAEAELTSMLSEYVSMELDLEILDMLIQNALTKEYWSTKPGFEYDPSTGDFVDLDSHTGTKNEWFETLGNKIQRVSNRIHQKTMRGGANFIVCSPDVATILESIEGYRVDTGGDQYNFAMGVQRVGTLYNRFQVYKNPYMLENIMLVGFRGQNFLETGAVYAPYVPLMMTPIVYDPNNFTPRRGVMTRYAKRIVRPEFYGLVIIDSTFNV
jgi:hypothetical protein